MKRLITVLSLGIYATGALAIMPPYGESVRRIHTLLSDESVRAVFGNLKPVKSVQEIADNTWEVKAGTSVADIRVECDKTARPIVGPCPLTVTVVGHGVDGATD